MLFRSLRTLLTILLPVCVCIVLLVAPAGATSRSQASQATVSAHGVTSHLVTQSAAEVHAYWTPERMKSAKPLDEVLAPAAKTAHRPVTQTGPAGFVAPALPQSGSASGSYKSSVLSPDSSVPPGSYSSFPYSTVGKVFFTQNGNNFECSGAAINSKNKSVVDTAGHCVYGGGHFDSYFQFCPQYLKGSSPQGCWVANYVATRNDWINTGSLEDDFGMAVVSPNNGNLLVNVVGGLGWVYNASANQTFTALGYPANSPYDGSKMIQCGPIGSSTVTGFDDGTVIAIPCDMHGGASGGPWIISFNGTFGYVNGHNDFHYNNDLKHEYTPYYDGDWFSLFNFVQSR
ncbi:MAG: hypothetical protein JO202_06930 [Ktedonobacteraceae bacterium]|nr:hypothetical protein [Ktedonobacteraceae bacterium]